MSRYKISGSWLTILAVCAAFAVVVFVPTMGSGTVEDVNAASAPATESAEVQPGSEATEAKNPETPGQDAETAVTNEVVEAVVEASDTATAPREMVKRNKVHLTTDPSGTLVTVKVMIAGPSINKDLYAFAFDLVLADPTVARYVPGSARAGGALRSGGGTTHVLAAQKGDRVTIGVTRLGAGKGTAVETGEHEIVSLDFKLLKKKATTKLRFDGSAPNGPAAIDSAGVVIGSVRFETAPTVIAGKS